MTLDLNDMMRIKLMVMTLLLTTWYAEAQFIKEQAVNVLIGYGLTAPYYSVDEIADSGFYAQGEWILTPASWVDFRPYAGLILTSSDGKDINDDPTDERAESKALLLGGKARVKAPIPWVAPYLEIGIGTSIGNFETQTTYSAFDRTGIVYHVPFAFGLELGRNHSVDLGFTYYFQPSVEQFAGAFAVGMSFPVDGKSNTALQD